MQISQSVSSLKSSSNKVKMSYRDQQGVALVVVLLFLILIMLAGVMAVRQSNTDLKTATADQINTVLLQSSDSALQKLESVINNGKATVTDANSSTLYSDATSYSGVFGSFMGVNATKTIGNEYIYCYNPRSNLYTQANATIYKAGTTNVLNSINYGICDTSKNSNYTSDRQTTMTQVSIVSTSSVAGTATPAPFSQMMTGADSELDNSRIYHFDIRATSLLPSYSPPTADCLKSSSVPVVSGSASTTTSTSPILTCLHNSNTPSKMVYEQADLRPEQEIKTCLNFGADSSVKC